MIRIRLLLCIIFMQVDISFTFHVADYRITNTVKYRQTRSSCVPLWQAHSSDQTTKSEQGKALQARWNSNYQKLVEFHKQHGHLRMEYGSKLYNWMANQRKKRSNPTWRGSLTEEQIQLLDDIGFEWSHWESKYKKLAEFHKQHGHLRVEYGSKLYSWIINQRKKRFDPAWRGPLTEEQIKLLDDIGFKWEVRGGNQMAPWLANYGELQEFHKQHGHLQVEYGTSLYNWIINQRRKRLDSSRYANLTEEQIKLLDEIGFEWAPRKGPRDIDWNSKYKELSEFHKKHGHLRVGNNSRLYHWMMIQRKKKSDPTWRGSLTEEQITLLDDIGFEWKGLFERKWDLKYKELAEFHKEHGHLRVEFGTSLYNWMVHQRKKRLEPTWRGPLTEEQIKLLDDIGFEWETRKGRNPSTSKS